jgi:DHA3 family macrolide efflux protein-like MFS transporter
MMSMRSKLNSNKMMVFRWLWLGQTVSLFGSGLTAFALGVWVFESSGSVTLFAMIGLSAVLPRVLLSPLAGVVVDRWDRRWVMLVSDSVAGLGTLVTACLALSGALELWMVYPLAAVLAGAGTLQWPAYTATTSLLVPKDQLGRANGMQ